MLAFSIDSEFHKRLFDYMERGGKMGVNILKNGDVAELSEIIVFGAGHYGIMSICLFQHMGIRVLACMDNDLKKQGKEILNSVICIKPYFGKSVPIVIAIMNEEIRETIHVQCKQMGYKEIFFLDVDKLESSLNLIPDKEYLEMKFALVFGGKKLNLDNPQTFNEKMQWLKLYNRKPEYTELVDKYEVKGYIAKTLGVEYVIPTLGVWCSFDEIDFDSLPQQFVLKCTHDSGGLVIVRDKNKFNKEVAKQKIEKSLKVNYYLASREWPYKNVRPRIIAEKYMQDKQTDNLSVYKVFNFSGEPYIIQVVQNDKMPNETVDYFDTDWKHLNLRQIFSNSDKQIKRPEKLTEMLNIAKKIAQGFPFIRTDFYLINGEIYFSEFTFYSDAGFGKFEPADWDMKLGEKIIL